MKQQIERTISITIEHELYVGFTPCMADGLWFTEEKKFEELQDGVVRRKHSQQIGNFKISVKETIDKSGNLIDEDGKRRIDELTLETNMNDEDITRFKTKWESEWNPKFGPNNEST